MSEASFDFTRLLAPTAAAPAPFPAGLPRYPFVGGHNDPEQVPAELIAEAAAAVIRREGADLAKYHLGRGPLGVPALRQCVVDKLAKRRGIITTIDEVLITSGSNQAIDFLCRTMVAPGDTVLAEEHCYEGALKRFQAAGARVLPMAMDADGIVVEVLAAQLEWLASGGLKPRFIYTIPTVQNPTGSILPTDRREALIALARLHDLAILEDDCYADLVWLDQNPGLALKALAPERVLYIGSFSKSFAPAVRLGYLIAPWPLMSRILPAKTDAGTGALDQMIVAEYLSRQPDELIERLRSALHAKMRVMIEAVEREFGTVVECRAPKGGIFVWLKLPDHVDVRTLVAPAEQAGLVFNPGPSWAVEPEAARSFLRLCFALPTEDQIVEGVATLARICFQQTGVPAIAGNCRLDA
ncbi:PLP-dependent aminotransferase family protein [Azospirillum sp. TSA2s]|uniref:aminotransferase-like domain-containing protein n=1 Tax=Azospirillum sp. TSA2s TaxID=709810 RepID=UPI0010AAAF99|nr:PLP-dependent aminotransferase family protein [Azospirillum sp. TSA2s]QCG94614.1 PLP-dependent aminotransferase family protein [Azospirillum sp. TSA2s]